MPARRRQRGATVHSGGDPLVASPWRATLQACHRGGPYAVCYTPGQRRPRHVQHPPKMPGGLHTSVLPLLVATGAAGQGEASCQEDVEAAAARGVALLKMSSGTRGGWDNGEQQPARLLQLFTAKWTRAHIHWQGCIQTPAVGFTWTPLPPETVGGALFSVCLDLQPCSGMRIAGCSARRAACVHAPRGSNCWAVLPKTQRAG